MTKKIEKRRFFYNVPKDSPIAKWCESQDSFTKSLNWLIKSVIHLTGNDHIDIFDYISQQDNLVDFLSQSSSSNTISEKKTDKTTSNDDTQAENKKTDNSESNGNRLLKVNATEKGSESKNTNKVNTNDFKDIPGLFNGADDFN